MAATAVAGAFHPTKEEMGEFRYVLEFARMLGGSVRYLVTDAGTVLTEPGILGATADEERTPADLLAEAAILTTLSHAISAHHAAREANALADEQHREIARREARRSRARAQHQSRREQACALGSQYPTPTA